MKLALDTSVLIHILSNKQPTDPQQVQHWRASRVLLAVPEFQLALPAPTLAEALIYIPHDKMGTVSHLLTQKFEILTTDFESARIAATLWQGKLSGVGKQCLKFDYLILGTVARFTHISGFCTLDVGQAGATKRLPRKISVGSPHDFLVEKGINLELDFT